MRTFLRLQAVLLILVFLLSVVAVAQNAKPGKSEDDCTRTSNSSALAASGAIL
jgi:hypothetical protein